MSPLRATTVRVDSSAGPRDVSLGRGPAFSGPRRTLIGQRIASIIDIASPWPDHVHLAVDALRAMPHESDVSSPGVGPVAFGALPFDRNRPARMIVPQVLHGSDGDGTRWTTTITGKHLDPDPGGSPQDRPPVRPTRITVESDDPGSWCRLVSDATEKIRAGELRKVVLARAIRLTADEDFDVAAIADRLARAHPTALRWSIDGFVGASPELLVSRIGDVVRAQPMAGTTPRTGDPARDAALAARLLASQKNREEHQITIDAVHDALLGWCSYLDGEPEPSVIGAGSVQHLATLVEGRLSHPAPSVLDLVAALHPTPAVGGFPAAVATEMIAEFETTDRGRYAGPVGWVDSAGNGAWAVGLRSAQIDGNEALMFAGVGVVEDSDPATELAETDAKFAAMLPHLAVI